jgi:hypothetical protein
MFDGTDSPAGARRGRGEAGRGRDRAGVAVGRRAAAVQQRLLLAEHVRPQGRGVAQLADVLEALADVLGLPRHRVRQRHLGVVDRLGRGRVVDLLAAAQRDAGRAVHAAGRGGLAAELRQRQALRLRELRVEERRLVGDAAGLRVGPAEDLPELDRGALAVVLPRHRVPQRRLAGHEDLRGLEQVVGGQLGVVPAGLRVGLVPVLGDGLAQSVEVGAHRGELVGGQRLAQGVDRGHALLVVALADAGALADALAGDEHVVARVVVGVGLAQRRLVALELLDDGGALVVGADGAAAAVGAAVAAEKLGSAGHDPSRR